MDQNPPLYDMDGSCQLAALRLLSGYNHFMVPPEVHSLVAPLLSLPPPPTCLPTYCQHLPVRNTPLLTPPPCDADARRRGEKRPIPAELKDEKYYERRRRNNQAAKKSRDARRIREDQIAWRACLLEQENASLRAHVTALRRETIALRSIIASRDDLTTVTPKDDTRYAVTSKDDTRYAVTSKDDTRYAVTSKDDTRYNVTSKEDTRYAVTSRNDSLAALSQQPVKTPD